MSKKLEAMMLLKMLPDARERMVEAYKSYYKARHDDYELKLLKETKEYYRILDELAAYQKNLENKIQQKSRKEW